MKKINIYLIIILFLFFYGCESEIVENDISYSERMVVRGLLEAGKPIQVYFGRTLPLQEAFDSSKANLQNVVALIQNKNRIDTLVYTYGGIYQTKNMIAQNGEKYLLFAEWNGRTISAETTVPFTTSFQAGRLDTLIQNNDTTFFIRGFLTPRVGAVYGGTWSVISSNPSYVLEDSVLNELQREEDKDLLGNLIIKTRPIPKEIVRQWRNSLFIRIHAFDENFYNFFLTQDSNNATNNIFSSSGINLRWNIKGDAIGMFIGKSDFLIRI